MPGARARPTSRRAAGRLLLAGAALATAACAQDGTELAVLINDYRASPQRCEGSSVPAAGPLAPSPALAAARIAPGADLQASLKAVGYDAAHAQAIVVSGPRDAGAAAGFFKSKYCRVLASREFADIGVSRDGAAWRVVLARPLLAADLGEWRAEGDEVLRLTNAARAAARRCGSERFPPAPALYWDDRLAAAASAHSRDMASRDYFSHTGPTGEKVDARADRAGYGWQRIGENIATGQGSARRVVDGWLASPGHCANIMNADFRAMGAAYALNRESRTGIFWAQVFGTPR